MGEDEGFCSVHSGLDGLRDGRSADEADGVADEDERDDGIVDIVRLFEVGDQRSWRCVVKAILEVHETDG